ncbi:MAG: SirB2 family protein [Telluria sp.]
MEYVHVRHLHMGMAALSGTLFLLRGIWMLRAPAMLARPWVRVLPHMVDTALLASALVMVVWSGQYPFVQPWLGAKVTALVLYIGLGMVALRHGASRPVRLFALIAALATFGYIVLVAVTRQPLPFA